MSTGSNNSSPSLAQPLQPSFPGCFVDSEFRYTLFTVYYSLLVSLGSGINLYALYVYVLHPARKKLNELRILIINLIISDLLFISVLPLWAIYFHQHGNWILKPSLCNFAGFMFYVSKYCSVVFLGAINYNQFQAITKPISAAQLSTQKRGFYITFNVWILISGSGMYYLIGGDPIRENVKGQIFLRCFERHNINSNNASIFAIHVIICACFFLLTLLVLVWNLLIIQSLINKTQAMNSSAERLKEIGFVCTILTLFLICFLPYHLLDLPWTMASLDMGMKMSCQSKRQLSDAHQVTLCFLSASSLLNPIVYCFLTKKFREHVTEKVESIKESCICFRKTTKNGKEEKVGPEPASIILQPTGVEGDL